jgi:hypothetical protein
MELGENPHPKLKPKIVTLTVNDLYCQYIAQISPCANYALSIQIIPFYALKAMLNHSLDNDVTGGYVCMSVDRLRVPVQRVTERILEMTKIGGKTVEGSLMDVTVA